MNEGKTNKAIALLGNNPSSVSVCLLIVAVKGRKNYRSVDACCFCPLQVGGGIYGGDRGLERGSDAG